MDMPTKAKHNIAELKNAILRFAESCPDKVHDYQKNDRIIHEGNPAEDCFLIKEGVVSILIKTEASNTETQIALRFEGDLVGETAFLQPHARRTASVVVTSEKATLIRLSRNDVFELLRRDPGIQETLILLWELGATRKSETLQVIKGHILVQNKLMSVLIGDIHNFTALGEAVWEEHVNAFLFDFVEQAEEIAIGHGGDFEDQGDGFKVVFGGSAHAADSATCAQEFVGAFHHLRSSWCEVNDAFGNIGLGIGICSDFMSIRTRQGSPRKEGRVLGHAINIASALSKHKQTPSDVDIFINEHARVLIESEEFLVSGPQQQWLEQLGRIVPIYCLFPEDSQPSSINRLVPSALKKGIVAMDSPLTILFLASDPTDASRLRISEEAREIEEKLRLSKHRDRFVFQQRCAVRPVDLSQALLDVEPHIVHFSGHGSKYGELCLEDKIGETHPISPDSLAALFDEFSANVKCVILNACYSEIQAEALVTHIDHVIGMDKPISDGAAIAFSIGFYQGLGAGKSIEEAFRLGTIQIGMQGNVNNKFTPILKAKLVN